MTNAHDVLFCLSVAERGTEVTLRWPNNYDHQYQQAQKFGRFYDFRFLRYIAAVGHAKGFRTCFDIGTCFGNHAVYFGAIMGCHVECFEPNVSLIPVINANLEHSHISHRTHNVALREIEGAAALSIVEGNVGASHLVNFKQRAAEDQVRVCALDTYSVEMNLPDPDFLKVDTQGYEVKILRAAGELLTRSNADVFIEIARENIAEARLLLGKLGYQRVMNFGKNYHFSRTTSLFQRLIFLAQAVMIDVEVSLTKTFTRRGGAAAVGR